MPTGFSNVRSTEYSLLYTLYNECRNKFEYFYPFYFQKKRDDTLLSLENTIHDIQIIALFARRPKTKYVNSDYIEISFRKTLFEQIHILNSLNIPVIAGSPLASNIENVGFGAKMQWFELISGEIRDIVNYRFDCCNLKEDDLIKEIKPINISDINCILEKAPKNDWKGLITLVKEWYDTYFTHYHTYHRLNLFKSVSSQKPIFVSYKLNK